MNLSPHVQHLSSSFDENSQVFREIFQKDPTIKFRQITFSMDRRQALLLFADGMVNNTLINEHIIEPLIQFQGILPLDRVPEYIQERIVYSNDVTTNDKISDLIIEILSGNTVLLIEGCSAALVLASRGFQSRSIAEPPAEKVLQGPREGFTEVLLFNVSLVRRKLCNPDLRFEFRRIGKQSRTMVAVAYMDGIADTKILQELQNRLDQIRIDGILDANYVEELIKDAPWSPFRTIGSSERPDIITAKLLEGHAAIFIDGTPVVLTAPYFFLEYFQTNDDYYTNFYAATFNRWLRILGFWATISLPAIFLGLFTFHQELLPTRFLMNLSAAREQLPFPTLLEMLLLIFGFELIREGGAKAPANFGQTLGIVGGLVLGQAAVDAKLVSIPVVIIIAFTGITGLMIPQLKSPVILFRLAFLFLASLWGLPGYLAGLFCLLLHLSSLKSFTIPYTSSLSYSRRAMLQDTFLRAPWFRMIYRPDALAKKNHRRQLRCIFLLLLPLFLTGCTSSQEINDVALISGITVEIQEDVWFVHAQVSELSKDEENLRVISGQGSSFEKAMENLHESANEGLYLHHSKSVALTGDFSRSQLSQVVTYILDHRELRIASDVVSFWDTSADSIDHIRLQDFLLTKQRNDDFTVPKAYQLFHHITADSEIIPIPLLSIQDAVFQLEGTYSVKGDNAHGN